jgi:aryl-alcohol dehydrogenase-like predicted oxidoreductase
MADDLLLPRRDFVHAGAVGAAALLGNPLPVWGDGGTAKLPHGVLGKTGVRVPILGLGMVAAGNLEDPKEAVALAHRAIDLGVTYIDAAPPRTRIVPFTGYSRAQEVLHGVLRERRNEVFVTTKCLETDFEETLALLRRSLEQLGVDQVDLAYTHAVGHAVYDLDDLVADSGPMAALEQAKRDGLTRFVGITAHNRPEKVARVVARRDIDVMMVPMNIVDRHTYPFAELVGPAVRRMNIGLAAMKVFGGGLTRCMMPEELRHASFRFAQSVQGVALTVIGMGSVKELEQNVEWARTFKAMTAAEADELKPKTVALAKQWGAHFDRLDPKGEKGRPLLNT